MLMAMVGKVRGCSTPDRQLSRGVGDTGSSKCAVVGRNGELGPSPGRGLRVQVPPGRPEATRVRASVGTGVPGGRDVGARGVHYSGQESSRNAEAVQPRPHLYTRSDKDA